MRYILSLCLALCFVGFALPSQANEPRRVLVVGDSLLDWQRIRGQSIPQVLARKTGWEVASRAASGASMYRSGTTDNPRAVIPTQYQPDNWDWVVVNGGANDLLTKCGCRRCSRVLNEIISPDGKSGIMVDLVRRARSDGAGVVMIGYLGNPRPNLFNGCREEVFEMVRRQKLLAEALPNVIYLSSRDAVDVNRRGTFAFDGIHPSGRSTKRIGTYLAQTLVNMDARKRR